MYLQMVNPHILLPSHTAVPILQLYSDEAADHRVHLHLSLPSIMSLIAAVRLNLIMDGKGTSRLPFPECTERMRKTMMTPPVPHNLEARAGERVWDNLAPAVSAPNICVPALYENTCKTITQSKKKLHLMLSAFNFLPNLISYVYNYMLIFDIASLLCGVVNW